jgi:ABC-type transporter Mla MlaB component
MAPLRERTIVFAIDGPITRSDLPGLCNRVRGVLEGSGAEVALCEVGTVAEVDAVTIDALARLQLLARRLGCQVRLRNASDELLELVAFMGLTNVLAESRPIDQRSVKR